MVHRSAVYHTVQKYDSIHVNTGYFREYNSIPSSCMPNTETIKHHVANSTKRPDTLTHVWSSLQLVCIRFSKLAAKQYSRSTNHDWRQYHIPSLQIVGLKIPSRGYRLRWASNSSGRCPPRALRRQICRLGHPSEPTQWGGCPHGLWWSWR
jgi:hypothetical protein